MWNKLVLMLLFMASLALASCTNEFTLDDDASTTVDGTVFKLVDSGDRYSEVTLKVGSDEVDFTGQYATTDDWFIQAVTVTPDWSTFQASKFFSQSENSEFTMDTCGRSAAEIGDHEMIMLPSPYSHALFLVDGESIALSSSDDTSYVDGHILKLISKDGSSEDGTTSAKIILKPLKTRTAAAGTEFTLSWSNYPAATIDGKTARLAAGDMGSIVWDGATITLPQVGESAPLGTGYAVRTTALYSDSVSLVITRMAAPVNGRLILDCLSKPYGGLSDGSSIGFQKTDGKRVLVSRDSSSSAESLAANELTAHSDWAFYLDSLSTSGSSCQGVLYASRQASASGDSAYLDATQDMRFAEVAGTLVFLVSADPSSATLFIAGYGKTLVPVGGTVGLDGSELALTAASKDKASVRITAAATPPAPTATPRPTATPKPTPTKSPSTGLVTTHYSLLDSFIDWLASLLHF